MRFFKANLSKNRLNPSHLTMRLVLRGDELFQLPAANRSLQVISGMAWITTAGDDILLTNGERLWLLAAKDKTLVSALGHTPLILEVFGDKRSSLPGTLITPS